VKALLRPASVVLSTIFASSFCTSERKRKSHSRSRVFVTPLRAAAFHMNPSAATKRPIVGTQSAHNVVVSGGGTTFASRLWSRLESFYRSRPAGCLPTRLGSLHPTPLSAVGRPALHGPTLGAFPRQLLLKAIPQVARAHLFLLLISLLLTVLLAFVSHGRPPSCRK
jgi:hypothetical protein